MDSGNYKTAINTTIVATALAYLLIPNILFLLGWVQWWFSIPVAGLLVCTCIYVCRHLPAARICIGPHPLPGILLTLLVCFLAVESLGYSGRVPQSSDFLVRNAMYDTLVRCDWPLKSSTGDYFVYYHVFYLPPALISRMLAGGLSHTCILYLWTFTGLLLVAALLSVRFGALKGAFALFIMLTLGYLTDWIRVTYSALDQLNIVSKNDIAHFLSIFPTPYTDALASNWRAVAIDSPHHGIPLLLFLVLVATNRLSPKHVFFCSTLVILASPYGAMGVFVYLIIRYHTFIRNNIVSLFKGISWSGILLLIPAAAFFSITDGKISIYPIFSNHTVSYTNWIFFYLVCVALTLGPACYFVSKRYRKTSAFLVFTLASLTLPFIYNPSSSNTYNTVLKLCAVTSFCQAWVYLPAFFKTTGKKKLLFLLFLTTASSYAILHTVKQVYFFSSDPKKQRLNCQSGWQGHMNHQDHRYYKNFFTSANIPFILYQNEGESAQHVLSPFSTGRRGSELPEGNE